MENVDKELVSEIHTIYQMLTDINNIILDERERGVELYEMAKENYDELRRKMENDDVPSEDGAIEEALNSALDKVTNAYRELVKSSEKVPKIMDVIGKMQVAKYKGDTLLKIASGNFEKEIDIGNVDDKMKLLREKRKQLSQASNFMDQSE